MPKTRVILAVLVAALTLGAVGPASASAEESTKMAWFVGGTKLANGATAAIASTAAVDTPFVFTAPGLSLKIRCTNLSTPKADIEGGEEESAKEQSDNFEDCSELSPSDCELESSTIKIGGGYYIYSLSYAFYIFKTVLERYYPGLKGGALATITFGGSSCKLAGEKPVDGELTLNDPTLPSEEKLQAVEALNTYENNSLEIDGSKFYVESGKALLKLTSGSKWSFRE